MGFDKSCQFLQDNRTLLYCFRKNTEGAVLPGHTHSTGRKSCRATAVRARLHERRSTVSTRFNLHVHTTNHKDAIPNDIETIYKRKKRYNLIDVCVMCAVRGGWGMSRHICVGNTLGILGSYGAIGVQVLPTTFQVCGEPRNASTH